MKNSLPKVTFFCVKNNQAKIQLICSKAQEAFHQEKRLLLAVSSLEAAHYIDALLWRIPEESFLPHVVTQHPTSEWIAITTLETHNLNQASRLLNLCQAASPLYQEFEEIYELNDETHPQRKEWAQKRLDDYRSKGIWVKEG